MTTYTTQQENFFSAVVETSSDIMLEARAGCGKTTGLVEAAKRLRLAQPACSVLAVAFNKSIATELGERMPSGVFTSTLHSLGFGILKRCMPETRFRVESRKYMDILAAKASGIEWEDRLKIVDALDSVRQRLVKPEDLDEDQIAMTLEEQGNEAKWAALAYSAFQIGMEELHQGKIDFTDMLYGPYALGLRPSQRYAMVMVDEAQDLNSLQEWMVLRHIESRQGRLIICGDPKQAIYGFAGASEDGMAHLALKRTSIGKQVMVCPISKTFRCGAEIVHFAKTECMPDDQLENFVSARASGSGEVIHLDEIAGNQLEVEDFKEGEAILSRTNRPLMEAAVWFLANEHGFKLNGKEFIKQLKSRMCRGLSNSLDKNAARRQVQSWLEERIEFAESINRPNLADRHRDIAECCFVFIDLPSISTVKDIKNKLDDLEHDRPGPTLSSVHKAKGLEWEKVWWIGRDDHLVAMKKRDELDDPKSQEWNIQYVAATRAKDELVIVNKLPAHIGD